MMPDAKNKKPAQRRVSVDWAIYQISLKITLICCILQATMQKNESLFVFNSV